MTFLTHDSDKPTTREDPSQTATDHSTSFLGTVIPTNLLRPQYPRMSSCGEKDRLFSWGETPGFQAGNRNKSVRFQVVLRIRYG